MLLACGFSGHGTPLNYFPSLEMMVVVGGEDDGGDSHNCHPCDARGRHSAKPSCWSGDFRAGNSPQTLQLFVCVEIFLT
jgi:hypothetical protein